MRLLLDESVDRRLARDIQGHDVFTVFDLGRDSVRNGALLARAAGQFDAFVTVDRNLALQRIDSNRNLPRRDCHPPRLHSLLVLDSNGLDSIALVLSRPPSSSKIAA